MKTTKFQGLKIVIENPAGSIRNGIDHASGKPWAVTMAYDYGEILGTEGVDGDPVDCFIGPIKNAKFAYVIHQLSKLSGEWDEDKCMLGFQDAMAAKQAYNKCFDEPDHFYGTLEAIPMDVFKAKVRATKTNPQMIHAVQELKGIKQGDPVTVDGFHGRGVVKYIQNGRVQIQFRSGLLITRAPEFVHVISSDYRSGYSSMAAGKSKKKSKKGSIGEATSVPEDDTLTHHAYKTVLWGVDPETGDVFPPAHSSVERLRRKHRLDIHRANTHMTSSIQAGGVGSGRHAEDLQRKQAEARKEYRRIYKLATQAGLKGKDAHSAAIEAYLNKFSAISRMHSSSGLQDVELEQLTPGKKGKGIRKVGTQFCVEGDGVDKNFGCYPSKEQAQAVASGKSFIEPLLPKEMQNSYQQFKVKLKKPKNIGLPSVGHRHSNPSGIKGPGMRRPNPSFLDAGGPGSGRRKEVYNVKDQRKVRDLLRKLGYEWKKSSGVNRGFAVSVYRHPDGHRAEYREYADMLKLNAPDDHHKQAEKLEIKAFADYGEPMAGSMQHAHIDPKVWFKAPSNKDHTPVPTDDPGETNDKFLDVTKRKQAEKDRMKLLKRSSPAGNPPAIPARTTLLTPHSAVYMPQASFAAQRKGRVRRNGGMFRGFEAAKI